MLQAVIKIGFPYETFHHIKDLYQVHIRDMNVILSHLQLIVQSLTIAIVFELIYYTNGNF